MRFLRAAVRRVVGLFVRDWLQSAVVVVILGVGWFAVARVGAPAVVVMVLLLAGQLVWFASVEGGRAAGEARPSGQ